MARNRNTSPAPEAPEPTPLTGETLPDPDEIGGQMQGISDYTVKILTGVRHGTRNRNGKSQPVATQKALATDGTIVTIELGEEDEELVKNQDYAISGFVNVNQWHAALSGRSGNNVYVKNLLSAEPTQIDKKVFALKRVGSFVRELGTSPVLAPTVD